MADACLSAIGVATSASAVAAHYGARSGGGFIDGWLVDLVDADLVEEVAGLGIACRAVPAMMTDVSTAADLAAACLALAAELPSHGRA
jgi:LPPG:FO 2-phospho-L-lactate transferase